MRDQDLDPRKGRRTERGYVSEFVLVVQRKGHDL